jgi:hypothetical protein
MAPPAVLSAHITTADQLENTIPNEIGMPSLPPSSSTTSSLDPIPSAAPLPQPDIFQAELSEDLFFDLKLAFERLYELPGDIYHMGEAPRRTGYLPESLMKRLRKELARPDLQPGARIYEQRSGAMAPHKDTSVHSEGTHTFILYLGKCEGGTLHFEHHPPVEARQGTCVGFAKHITHWTTEVTGGVKRCIICDY